jgi:predicted RNA-binding protein
MKNKIEEYEIKETDTIGQVKKYTDLVKHLDMEKNKVNLIYIKKSYS